MRSIYDEQLKTLHDSLATMSALCEDAIAKAAKALQLNDLALAAEVHTVTERIDRLERDVQSQCLRLLLLQQPVAGDLRRVSAALKMVTDLERIGNQSADIADHFDGMKTLLIAAIRDDADAGSYAIDLLMMAKYLERIGDHAVNIAKWVIFAETGQLQM